MFREKSDDPIADSSKQESLDTIRTNIIAMLAHTGSEDEYISKDLDGVNVNKIDNYLYQLEIDQNLPVKLLLIRRARVGDKNRFETLCNYIDVHNVEFDPTLKNSIYFIETSDYAITFIPIQTGQRNVRIHLAPIGEFTPTFLKDRYKELTEKSDIENLKFLKFNKKDPD